MTRSAARNVAAVEATDPATLPSARPARTIAAA